MAVATSHSKGVMPDEEGCSNPKCDSRQPGRAFECIDPGDGDTCITCGTKQSSGGSLHHAHANEKGHREQTDDERREVDAARTFSEQMRERRGGAIDLESRCRYHARTSEAQSLQLAQKVLKDSARSKVEHLHPRSLAVPTKSDIEQHKRQIADHAGRLRALVSDGAPVSVVCAAASAAVSSIVGMAAGEAFSSSAAAAAIQDDDDDDDEDDEEGDDEDAPPKKYQRVSAVVDEFDSQMSLFIAKQSRESRQAQAVFRQAMSQQLKQETVSYTAADGTHHTLAEQDVRNAKAQIDQREMFGFAAAASSPASSSAAAAAAAASSPVASASAPDDASFSQPGSRSHELSDALRRSKVVQDTLHPRVDELFSWVYVNCILSDWTSPHALDPRVSRDYRGHSAQVELFNRTLQYVVQYKSLLSVQLHKQMRNVELYAMHALIIASWQSATPLSWGTMHSALDAYLVSRSEKQWQEQRDKAMHRYQNELLKAARDPAAKAPKVPDVGLPAKPKSLGRTSNLDRTLYAVAKALNIQGDWAALVQRFALRFLIQLGQRAHEQEVNEEVDKCVDVFNKHLRGVQDRDELRFQIGLAEPLPSPSPSSAAAAAASSSSSSAAASPAGPRLMWQFSSAVAAAACVRKVMGSKYLPRDPDNEKHCIVKEFKKTWAKKRPRPSVTKDGQASMQIKAARFAHVAGVQGRLVTECMKLF